MIIYRLSDRIPAKIGELTFWLSPLSFEQKTNLLGFKKMHAGAEVSDQAQFGRMAMKYALKGVDGLKTPSGEKYEPAKDPDGTISYAAVDEISSLSCLNEIVSSCVQFLGNVSDAKVEGVEFDLKGVVNAEKKD